MRREGELLMTAAGLTGRVELPLTETGRVGAFEGKVISQVLVGSSAGDIQKELDI